MQKITNPQITAKFASYPEHIQSKLHHLRQLILEAAEENEDIGEIEETLKWNEPSYLAKGGSTVRFDWKPKTPNQYVIYFNCKTTLIETFKEIYLDDFVYEGNRAIIFQLDDEIPQNALKHCITLSFKYHHIKHLPLLGV
jgi:uncharacterized protein (UPF0248 family)